MWFSGAKSSEWARGVPDGASLAVPARGRNGGELAQAAFHLDGHAVVAADRADFPRVPGRVGTRRSLSPGRRGQRPAGRQFLPGGRAVRTAS